MKFVKHARGCCILFGMATLSTRASEDVLTKVAEDPRCAHGLSWIAGSATWVTSQQIRLTEIPAPEFAESRRAEALKQLLMDTGFDARIDAVGNVIAEHAGVNPESAILVAAHIDTIFPDGTDVRVKRTGTRLFAPGISDNGAGLSALVGLARAIKESGICTERTIILAGDVGEEGEGNLRGVRALMQTYSSRLAAVIAVDGASTDYITAQGIASRRFEIGVAGPGGHSWSDFGTPNPITALARGIVRFASIGLRRNARSSYNFGVISGGASVNSIPARASVKVDLRSEDEREVGALEAALREAMEAGVRDELAQVDAATNALPLEFRSLGTRPAGRLSQDSPLLTAIRGVDRYLGIRSRIESSSTDANLPLSLGIPAVALGGGGQGGGAHSLEEWFDPSGRELGLKRLFLLVLSLAGIQP